MKKLFLSAILLGAFAFGYSQSAYYNDYRSSVTGTNWEAVASSLLLNSSQKQKLLNLNNQYPNYDSWNREYGNNPERWSTDRYSSIQRIMGNEKYVKYKNKYYKGQNPVALYNRNKNNDARYKHLTKKAKNKKQSYKSMDYKKSKKRGDGSHVWVKGNASTSAKAKGNGNGKGNGKGRK